jgi:thiaminase/transcriptional activator TenA
MHSVEVGMAAVLPCFWIYKKIGDYILEIQNKDNNPYQDWISTYAGEEFGLLVDKAIAICDEAAQNSTPAQQQLMTQAFITASRLEFAFWDSAYRLEKWNR